MQDNTHAPAEDYRLHLLFSIIAAILSVIAVLFVRHLIVNQDGLVKLTFAPQTATIIVDGKEKDSKQFYLSPGEHKISIQKYGFATQEQKILVEANTTKQLYFVLEPNIPITENWYLLQSDDYKISEAIHSATINEKATAKKKAYPIIEKLPEKTAHAIIGYGPCYQYDTCITIDASAEYVKEAIDKLRELDGDLGRYHIIIRDHSSPFRGEG